jgi:hypothetical protein
VGNELLPYQLHTLFLYETPRELGAAEVLLPKRLNKNKRDPDNAHDNYLGSPNTAIGEFKLERVVFKINSSRRRPFAPSIKATPKKHPVFLPVETFEGGS